MIRMYKLFFGTHVEIAIICDLLAVIAEYGVDSYRFARLQLSTARDIYYNASTSFTETERRKSAGVKM